MGRQWVKHNSAIGREELLALMENRQSPSEILNLILALCGSKASLMEIVRGYSSQAIQDAVWHLWQWKFTVDSGDEKQNHFDIADFRSLKE